MKTFIFFFLAVATFAAVQGATGYLNLAPAGTPQDKVQYCVTRNCTLIAHTGNIAEAARVFSFASSSGPGSAAFNTANLFSSTSFTQGTGTAFGGSGFPFFPFRKMLAAAPALPVCTVDPKYKAGPCCPEVSIPAGGDICTLATENDLNCDRLKIWNDAVKYPAAVGDSVQVCV